MSIYAGELKELDISYSRSGMYDYMTPHLTLKPLTLFGETGSSWYAYFAPDEAEQMQEQVQAMMSDLEWMTSNLSYNNVDLDKRRLAYLKKNGVQVYGAVVTGPVRELQKISENPEFRHVHLNRVEIWNWD
ncbi:putative anti-sigma-M factor YhdL [compost metagenome]